MALSPQYLLRSTARLQRGRDQRLCSALAELRPVKKEGSEAHSCTFGVIDTGAASCTNVITASAQRCADVGYPLGALAEDNISASLQLARAIDNKRQTHGEPEDDDRDVVFTSRGGLLEGVPLSVKEELVMGGSVSTCGVAWRAGEPPAPHNGALVRMLVEQGAVPLVRSNLPQFVMSSETDNAVWGRCVNPWRHDRICGGSSGGEAALVASRCTRVGIGTDIAGSVRIPALCCGCCGFRPTPQRLTTIGVQAVGFRAEAENVVQAAPGPLARTVDDLVAVLRCWLPDASMRRHVYGDEAFSLSAAFSSTASASSLAPAAPAVGVWEVDLMVPPLPFRLDVYNGRQASPHRPRRLKADTPLELQPPPGPEVAHIATSVGTAADGGRRLRVGYYTTDSFFEPAPACKRAVEEAAAALTSAGHDVIPWDPAAHGVDLTSAALAYGIFLGRDAMREMRVRGLRGELPGGLYRRFVAISAIPDALCIRQWIAALFRIAGRPRLADVILEGRHRDSLGVYDWHETRKGIQAALTSAMTVDGIDVLLSPGLATPAWKHGQVDDLEYGTSYAWLWNYLHMPAGVVPVTRVREEEQVYYPRSALPLYQRDLLSDAACAAMEGSAGLPVGVHLSGFPYEDELVLRAMGAVETGLTSLPAPSATASAITTTTSKVARGEAVPSSSSAVPASLTLASGGDGDSEEGWDPRGGCPEAVLQSTVAVQKAQGRGIEEAAKRLQLHAGDGSVDDDDEEAASLQQYASSAHWQLRLIQWPGGYALGYCLLVAQGLWPLLVELARALFLGR